MNDLEQERDFYRQYCNELGRRLLRLQKGQTQARREARRSRTTARLIRNIYRIADSGVSTTEINSYFLQIVLDTLSVDRAALLTYLPEQEQFIVQSSLGFSPSSRTIFSPPALPAKYYFVNSKSRPDPMINWLRELAGGPFLLWAFDPGARLAFLVSNDIEDQHLHRPFQANDREIIEGPLSLLIDILERKQAEEALRQSEEKYRLLAENVKDVIWTADLNFRFTYVSPSISTLSGYTAEEAIGQVIEEVLTPDSIEIATHTLAAELDRITTDGMIDQEISRTLELEQLCKDGSIIPIEAKVTFLRDSAGRPNGLLGITRDITERKRAEALIRNSLREKEILLQEIHHRVKNNLQIISSLLSLQSGYVEDPRAVASFQNSQNRIRSMALIHEMLYRSTDLAQVDLAEYIRDLGAFLCRSYQAQAHHIELDIEAENLRLEIDTAVPCGLILNELISNSLKHAFPEGRTGKIWVTLQTTGSGQIRMTVGDNGIGFPAAFDFRSTSTLGLQLVHTLVNQLKGCMEIERTPISRISITFGIRDQEEKV
jgi:PAS domain S-box-containing protein